MNDYEQQAVNFLTATGTEFKATFKENNFHFEGDKDKRDIYTIELKRGSRKYVFDFGQSIMNSQYYKDSIEGRTYTLNGGGRTGGYSINDIQKYQSGRQKLVLMVGKMPTAYDVLTCLQKYDVGTFQDFCSELGYDEDSKSAEKIYKSVVKEHDKVCSLWNDEEIEQLQEIQ